MNKLFFLLLLTLTGCAGWQRHSFLIHDHQTNQCYYLFNSTLAIEERASWYNLLGDRVRTSPDFDLMTVDNEDYYAAAQKMGIDPKQCSNGLNKR